MTEMKKYPTDFITHHLLIVIEDWLTPRYCPFCNSAHIENESPLSNNRQMWHCEKCGDFVIERKEQTYWSKLA